MIRRVLSLVLSALFVFAMVPVYAFAEEVPAETLQETEPLAEEQVAIIETVPTQVNPLYAGLISVEDVPYEYDFAVPLDLEYGTAAEAKAAIREGMKSRASQVTVYIQTVSQDFKALYKKLFNGALEHTGISTEGDYLAFQYASCGGGYGGYWDSQGNYYMTYVYNLTYYNTAEQEAAVDSAVTALLNQLNLYGKSDYEKVCGIYDWICSNVTYDYANQSNSSTLKYTAYAALIDRTAVCQGYSNLFYRLALALGVDSRIISGTGISNIGSGGHAWNITKLNGGYYNLDPTWDATYKQAGDDYQWFLKNDSDFSADHIADAQYTTAEFQSAYSVAAEDYDPLDYVLGYGSCGDNLNWVLELDGTLNITGEGAMYDYSAANPAPWCDQVEQIIAVVMETGATSIGDYAFHGCRDLLDITLPDTLQTIGSYAFYSSNALEEIVIPASVTAIKNRAFAWCTALVNVVFEGDAPAIASNAFHSVTTSASYKSTNAGWAADVLQNYGGTITWMPDCSNGHAEVIDEAVDATCTADGLTEGKHCSACGYVIVEQKVIPGGHTMEDGICTVCGFTEKVFAAQISGVNYDTLEEALAAAQPGDTVSLMADATAGDVVVKRGVTLDLNGHTLTAEYVFAVKGSHIVDNSADNTGLLVVDSNHMMVSSGNAHLSVRKGDGYMFVEILKLNELTDGNSYIFQPFFETVAHEHLAKGAENSGVQIAVRMTWTVPTGTAYQDFVYNDGSVADFVNSYDENTRKYGLALNVNIYTSIPSFTKQVILISDTGVELVCN